jgi:hypothetical protein
MHPAAVFLYHFREQIPPCFSMLLFILSSSLVNDEDEQKRADTTEKNLNMKKPRTIKKQWVKKRSA